MIEALAARRILPVIKHYPGIGQTTKDLHLFADKITLTGADTQPFSQLLQQYPNIGVMVSHVQLDGMFEGRPCSFSATCLAPFETTFSEVLVFSDALEMKSAQIAAQKLSSNSVPSTEATTSAVFTPTKSATSSGEKIAESSLSSLKRSFLYATAARAALEAGVDMLVFGQGVSTADLDATLSLLTDWYNQDKEFQQLVDAKLARLRPLRK